MNNSFYLLVIEDLTLEPCAAWQRWAPPSFDTNCWQSLSTWKAHGAPYLTGILSTVVSMISGWLFQRKLSGFVGSYLISKLSLSRTESISLIASPSGTPVTFLFSLHIELKCKNLPCLLHRWPAWPTDISTGINWLTTLSELVPWEKRCGHCQSSGP